MKFTSGVSVVVLSLAACSSARADYMMSVVGPGGESMLAASPGSSFTFHVVLDSDSADTNDSAVFRLAFSAPDLMYAPGWLTWGTPYVTGGIDDFAIPGHGESGEITAATHMDPVDVGTIDLYFENLTPAPSELFTEGTLVALTLTIPAAWSGPDTITINAIPEALTDGPSLVPTSAGDSLTITIPTPATLGVLAAAATRRRRNRTGGSA